MGEIKPKHTRHIVRFVHLPLMQRYCPLNSWYMSLVNRDTDGIACHFICPSCRGIVHWIACHFRQWPASGLLSHLSGFWLILFLHYCTPRVICWRHHPTGSWQYVSYMYFTGNCLVIAALWEERNKSATSFLLIALASTDNAVLLIGGILLCGIRYI